MEDLNKTIKIKVDFEDKSIDDMIILFERGESGAFDYGNKTMVLIREEYEENGQKKLGSFRKGFCKGIDTRYNCLVMTDFEKWCLDFLKENFKPHKAEILIKEETK